MSEKIWLNGVWRLEKFEVGKEYTTKSGSGSKIRVLMRDTHYQKPVVIEHIEGQFARAEFGGVNEILRVEEDKRDLWEEVKPKRPVGWALKDKHNRTIREGLAYVGHALGLTFAQEVSEQIIAAADIRMHDGDKLTWNWI